MNDRESRFDAEMYEIARNAIREAEASVDVEAAVSTTRLRSRRDDVDVVSLRRGPSALALFAAAAAVLGMVAGGLVVVLGGDQGTLRTHTAPGSVAAPVTTAPVAASSTSSPNRTQPSPIDVATTLTQATAVEIPPALSTTALPATSAPTTVNPQPSGASGFAVPACVVDLPCTELATLSDGGLVAFDPTASTFTLLDDSGETIRDVVETNAPITGRFADLVTVGPDDVVYVSVLPDDAVDPSSDLLAIPLFGPDAGVVRVLASGLDGSGDTDLVPGRNGLATVGCCSFDAVRPDPERPVIPWLGGATLDRPVFEITLNDSAYELTRHDLDGSTSFPLPGVATALRGMPYVVATVDGGALMLVYDGATSFSYLIRFRTGWPPDRVDNTDVLFLGQPGSQSATILLEPSGTVVSDENGEFIRRTPDEVGEPGWGGETSLDTIDWIISAPGLNEYIDAEQPTWAEDPRSLARQLHPQIGPNERLEATYDAVAQTMTITVSGFLDDSVTATRAVWPMGLGDDGLYRVGVGEVSQLCQPGRGHQDFRPEPCI